MTRVLITGGSGELGKHLVPRLTGSGFTVRILSRGSRRATDPKLEWAQASLGSGQGLGDAVKDVDIIVHAASTPLGANKIDTGGAQSLLDLTKGKLAHFFYISIVGVDRHPFFYYKAKLATETVIEKNDVPWTILRATQFHSFLGRLILPSFYRLPLFLLPKGFVFQPIDTSEVATRIVELLKQGRSGRAADIGGPEILPMDELARTWMTARKKNRRIFHFSMPGKTGAAFRQGIHTAPEHKYGTITWQQWLQQEYGRQN